MSDVEKPEQFGAYTVKSRLLLLAWNLRPLLGQPGSFVFPLLVEEDFSGTG